MAWIRTTCFDCGELYLPVRQLSAHVELPAGDCSYRFECPRCHCFVTRDCTAEVVEQLVSCGVELALEGAPSEPPGELPVPPVSPRDIERFAAVLADERAFNDALRELVPGR
ncbi:MAG: hypothetical protein QOJ19_1901 [Acidimicrobiia bacterium]|jgi:hypothetical protein|nr:hypothetical protein [Acidimicrobiia bacterium]